MSSLPADHLPKVQHNPDATCRWFTFTQLDGSLLKLLHFAQDRGLQGLWQAWPRPGSEACLTLVAYGLFQAALQCIVPGKRFEGPVTPKGNTPVYKVRSHCTASLHSQHTVTPFIVFAAGTLYMLSLVVLLYPLSSLGKLRYHPCALLQANGVQCYFITMAVFAGAWG